MRRRRPIRVRPWITAVTLVSCTAMLGFGSASPLAPSGGSANTAGHGERPIGVNFSPFFRLTTQAGRHLTGAELRGRPFIVLFGYTNCPDACPTALLDVTLLLQRLGHEGDRMRVLFVTVDPERDTVEQLGAYLDSFDPRIIGLTGSEADIAAVADAFGAPFRRRALEGAVSYSVDHAYAMFLVDRYGLLAKAIGYDDPDGLMDFTRRLLAQ